MLKTSLRRAAAALALLLFVLGGLLVLPAEAAHNTYTFNVMAPFSGYWDRHGYSDPSSHPRGALSGNWATDYYKEQGTRGYWYVSASDGGSVSAYIYYPSNACDASGWRTAGRRYRFDLKRSGVKHGHFGYVHVDPVNPSSGAVLNYTDGSYMSNGATIGWTKQYAYSANCYEVNSDTGTHWHVLAYNVPANHYSCWVPGPPDQAARTRHREAMCWA